MLLIGDIGGTKTHLALIEQSHPVKILSEKKYPSADYKSLYEIIEQFLKEFSSKVTGACFGIAGPVRDQRVQATNLPWVIDAKEIMEKLNVKDVYLINDLEANAYGLFVLEDKDFFVLNEGKKQEGNQALISAGTGLGQAGLFFDGNTHTPFACEGGHCDFAPRNDLEIDLFKFARKTYPHVSYERFLSGQGIEFLHAFFLEHRGKKVSEEIEVEFKDKDKASVISSFALDDKDELCSEALELFVSIYGAEAGNVALKFLSLNGLFIGGGIAPKILDKLKEKTFFQAFTDKGRFSDLLASIPIKVVLNDQAALLGSAEYILRKVL